MITAREISKTNLYQTPLFELCDDETNERFEQRILGELMRVGISQTTYPMRKGVLQFFEATYKGERIQGFCIYEKSDTIKNFILLDDVQDETGIAKVEIQEQHLVDVK